LPERELVGRLSIAATLVGRYGNLPHKGFSDRLLEEGVPVTELNRTQVLLTRAQHHYLKSRAVRQGSNVSAIVRELIQTDMERRQQAIENDPFWEIVGMVAGGDPDAGVEHDHFVYGTPRKSEAGV